MISRKTELKWADALESGKFKQGRDSLVSSGPRYCCLGVLGVLQGIDVVKRDETIGVLPRNMMGKQDCFTSLNDTHKWSFKQIAKAIRVLGRKKLVELHKDWEYNSVCRFNVYVAKAIKRAQKVKK